MSIPTIPVDLAANVERADQFSFFSVAEPLPVERMPANAAWKPMLGSPGIWDSDHFLEPQNDYGARPSITDDLLPTSGILETRQVEADLESATMFAYDLRREQSTLELTEPQIEADMLQRVRRVRPIVFSHALLKRIDVVGTQPHPNRSAAVPDAIAILDDAMISAGVYGGVIHVPAYLSSRVKADLGPDLRTLLGSRIHFFPSTAMASPQVYGTGRVFYAEAGAEGPQLGTEEDRSTPTDNAQGTMTRNRLHARGRIEGVIMFEETASFRIEVTDRLSMTST